MTRGPARPHRLRRARATGPARACVVDERADDRQQLAGQARSRSGDQVAHGVVLASGRCRHREGRQAGPTLEVGLTQGHADHPVDRQRAPAPDQRSVSGDQPAPSGRAGRGDQRVAEVAVSIARDPRRDREQRERPERHPSGQRTRATTTPPRADTTTTVTPRARVRRRRNAVEVRGTRAAAAGTAEPRTAVSTRIDCSRGAGGTRRLPPRSEPRPTRSPVAMARQRDPPASRSSSGSERSTPRIRRSSTLVARVVSSPRDTWSEPAGMPGQPKPPEGQRVAEDGEQRDEDGGGQPDLEDVEPEGGSRDVVDAGPDGGDPVRVQVGFAGDPPAQADEEEGRDRAGQGGRCEADPARGSKRTSSVSVSMGATFGRPRLRHRVGCRRRRQRARCRSSARRVEARFPASPSNVRGGALRSDVPVPISTLTSPSTRCSGCALTSTVRTRSRGTVIVLRARRPFRTCTTLAVIR